MPLASVIQFLFLALVTGLSLFALIRLNARVRIKYKSRRSLVMLLLCAFIVFLASALLLLVFGIILVTQISASVYVAGVLLILCSIVFLLVASVISKEREYFKQLEKIQKEHDASTGLPKYPVFLQTTKKMLARHSPDSPYYPAVMVILISGLRQLDRRVGFGVSDFVIRTVVERMHASLRTTDCMTRLSENLFAVHLNDLKKRDSVYTVCDNILKNIKAPVRLAADQAPIFPYIGIAYYQDHAFDEVLRYAQSAALEACDRGMEVITADAVTRLEKADNQILNILQRSIEAKSFKLFYQPQVALRSMHVIGVEALIRLPRKEWISIRIGELVELAERNGMIHQLDMIVFELLFEQVEKWLQKDLDIRIAVNMSAKSFKNHSLLDYIVETLRDNRRLGEHLKIEITETASVDDIEEIVDFIKRITSLGVLFCIDDFGTQYSSMEYMQRLPVHEVKIDKSFVLSALNDEASEKIVHSVIQLAHSLNLSVTAEGVENKQILDLLISWHCDQAQGFYFSQALSAGELEDYLQSSKHGGSD